MPAVTTLYDELDKLRGNICHDCKKRLLPREVSRLAPAIPSISAPFWRRVFQNRQLRLPSRPEANVTGSSQTSNLATSSSAVPTITLATSETVPITTGDTPVTNHEPERNSHALKPKSEPPEFSVTYNPDATRALNLDLEHVFAHESPAWSVKISPDGQRMAVGFEYSGATIISDMKTRSNVRSVSECFVGRSGLNLFSVFSWIVMSRIDY